MSANDELAGRMARMDAARLRGVLPPDELVAPMPKVAPPRPAGIPWVPIADMPEEWKDGREVLLWDPRHEAMHVAWWSVRYMWAGWERWGDTSTQLLPTHVAAINPPEGV